MRLILATALSLCLTLALLAPTADAQRAGSDVPAWAAPANPGTSSGTEAFDSHPSGPTLPPPPTPIPVEGGLALLALAGGAYAVRRLRQSRA